MMYTVSDFVCVQHDWNIGLLRHRWNGVERFAGLSLFQSVHESLLDIARKEQACCWLIELGAAPLAVEDQLWLENKWLPELAQTAVRRLAIVADDAYNLMVLEDLLGQQHPGTQRHVQLFADSTTALEWLTQSSGHARAMQQEWECGTQPLAIGA
ncbi:hypothetical protein F0P96_14420 [Hymenobacter busanensis]|uniref:Uncharacterized protein n=1 Tax=Hymenobacter busanensis TaxID=2607656 RepID=A0A7L4ZYM9_9BACT|nr:hypothetical protein [Hymenobacter busanensis]KAA9331435.1 hypothetical protein F0P96_14420 [Hymenobacter busanensis]QHJ08589.1 hypothetical protein GUY19_15350 [Hymenobacter busanensis]